MTSSLKPSSSRLQRFFFSRYWVLLGAVVMTMCLGATYSWSVFVQPLKAFLGIRQGSAQLPFSIFYIMFPLMTVFAGPLMSRLSPRWSAVAGGIVFGGGWMMASLGEHGYILTISGIGILGGLGVGMAYVVPISTCMKWFPERKGLVTGLAVAGFGGGAAAISHIANHYMTVHGMTPFAMFRLLGMGFLALVCLAGLTMHGPPKETEKSESRPPSKNRVNPTAPSIKIEKKGESSSPYDASLELAETRVLEGEEMEETETKGVDGARERGAAQTATDRVKGREKEKEKGRESVHFRNVIGQPTFLILYGAMFCGLSAGFIVNSNLKELSKTATAQTGVAAVALFALANALGRILWGAAFDRISAGTALRLNLLFQAALLLAAPKLLHLSGGLAAVALIAGFNYGGVLVLYAASVAARWGSQHVGHVYGWLFSSNIPAALSPFAAGLIYDRWGTFTPSLLGAGLLLVGASVLLTINRRWFFHPHS